MLDYFFVGTILTGNESQLFWICKSSHMCEESVFVERALESSFGVFHHKFAESFVLLPKQMILLLCLAFGAPRFVRTTLVIECLADLKE